MVNETKPPPGWREEEPCAPGDEWAGDETGWLREETLADTLADAHRIAREEAQPYIAEALERIAEALEGRDFIDDSTSSVNLRVFAQAIAERRISCSLSRWKTSEALREIASGARPLPGGKP